MFGQVAAAFSGNIYIVNNNTNRLRFNEHWSRILKERLEREGYSVRVINGWRANWGRTEMGSLFNQSSIGEDVARVFMQQQFIDGDTFVFMDARTYVPILMHEYRSGRDEEYLVNILGFWSDGTYYDRGSLRGGMIGDPKRWARLYEKSIASCCDKNLIVNEIQLNKFKYYIKDDDSVDYCPLPMVRPDDTSLWDSRFDDQSKEDLILFEDNYNVHDDKFKSKLFELIKKDLPQYRFRRLDDVGYAHDKYYDLLSRARIMFGINLFESDPYLYVEAMRFGVTPIVPNKGIYEDMFGQYGYTYDSDIIERNRYIDFIRRKGEIYKHIENHMTGIDDVISNFDEIYEKYYGVDLFLDYLKAYENEVSD